MYIKYHCSKCYKGFEIKEKCEIHEKKCADCYLCKNSQKTNIGWGIDCKLNNKQKHKPHQCKDYIELPAKNADK